MTYTHIHRQSHTLSLVDAFQPGAVRTTVLGRLKTLTYLDDQLVTEEEAAAAVQIAVDCRINQVRDQPPRRGAYRTHYAYLPP